MKLSTLIVTADDFGMAREVNEAVEMAHRHGILTCASLMVGGAAAPEAIAMARRISTLKVGLHLVLVEDRPVLPPAAIPDLVDADGLFRRDLIQVGTEMFLRPKVKQQLAAEITAQFEAFHATGLSIDHVNAHKHYHLHPTVASLILDIGPRFGMRALRVPIEPPSTIQSIEPGTARLIPMITAPWSRLLSYRARHSGLQVADQVFGLAWSGAMTNSRLQSVLSRLPEGITEIYAHPATSGGFEGAADGYRYAEELAALVSPETVALVRQAKIRLCGFGDLN